MYWIVARKRQGTRLVMVLSDERSKEEITRIKFIHRKLDMLIKQEKKIGNRVNLKARTCGHDDDNEGRVMEISHLRSVEIKSYSVKTEKKNCIRFIHEPFTYMVKSCEKIPEKI